MIHKQRAGFISGTALALLLISLTAAAGLIRGLDEAARAAGEDLAWIRASLAYEDALIRLDLGKTAQDYSDHRYRVTVEPVSGGHRLRLWDHEEIREEQWLSGGGS